MLHTKEFHYYNDRLADLQTYQKQQDATGYHMLEKHLDRYLKAQPVFLKWLNKNPQYDHRCTAFCRADA